MLISKAPDNVCRQKTNIVHFVAIWAQQRKILKGIVLSILVEMCNFKNRCNAKTADHAQMHNTAICWSPVTR